MYKINSNTLPSSNIEEAIKAARNNSAMQMNANTVTLPSEPVRAEVWAVNEMKQIVASTFVVVANQLESKKALKLKTAPSYQLNRIAG